MADQSAPLKVRVLQSRSTRLAEMLPHPQRQRPKPSQRRLSVSSHHHWCSWPLHCKKSQDIHSCSFQPFLRERGTGMGTVSQLCISQYIPSELPLWAPGKRFPGTTRTIRRGTRKDTALPVQTQEKPFSETETAQLGEAASAFTWLNAIKIQTLQLSSSLFF